VLIATLLLDFNCGKGPHKMLADQRKEEFPNIFSTSKRMHVLKGNLRNSPKNSPTTTPSTIVAKVPAQDACGSKEEGIFPKFSNCKLVKNLCFLQSSKALFFVRNQS
jgi:hypothetical protein